MPQEFAAGASYEQTNSEPCRKEGGTALNVSTVFEKSLVEEVSLMLAAQHSKSSAQLSLKIPVLGSNIEAQGFPAQDEQQQVNLDLDILWPDSPTMTPTLLTCISTHQESQKLDTSKKPHHPHAEELIRQTV